MKLYRNLLLLLSVVSLFSCRNLYDQFSDYSYANQLSGMSLYDPGLEFDSMRDIGEWIQDNISYEISYSVTGPEETVAAGVGDCKAISVLFMDLAYYSLGIKCDLVCLDLSSVSREIIEGGDANHCMVIYEGQIYEPQNGRKYYGKIGYRYSFDHVFSD